MKKNKKDSYTWYNTIIEKERRVQKVGYSFSIPANRLYHFCINFIRCSGSLILQFGFEWPWYQKESNLTFEYKSHKCNQ